MIPLFCASIFTLGFVPLPRSNANVRVVGFFATLSIKHVVILNINTWQLLAFQAYALQNSSGKGHFLEGAKKKLGECVVSTL